MPPRPKPIKPGSGFPLSRQIVDVFPAPGWLADFSAQDGVMGTLPLIGWAMVADGTVVGLVAMDRVALCTDLDNFIGYRREG